MEVVYLQLDHLSPEYFSAHLISLGFAAVDVFRIVYGIKWHEPTKL